MCQVYLPIPAYGPQQAVIVHFFALIMTASRPDAGSPQADGAVFVPGYLNLSGIISLLFCASPQLERLPGLREACSKGRQEAQRNYCAIEKQRYLVQRHKRPRQNMRRVNHRKHAPRNGEE